MKVFLFAILLVILSSCNPVKYTFSPESSQYGIEFRTGKWLMNEIESPAASRNQLTTYCINTFKTYLGDNLIHLRNTNKSMIVRNVPLHADTEKLKEIKNGTGFDYLINIKTNVIKEDLKYHVIGSIDRERANQVRTSLEIYDLNKPELIYFQEVNGSLSIENDSKDVHIITTAEKIAEKSLKKIFKKIKQNHTVKTY